MLYRNSEGINNVRERDISHVALNKMIETDTNNE